MSSIAMTERRQTAKRMKTDQMMKNEAVKRQKEEKRIQKEEKKKQKEREALRKKEEARENKRIQKEKKEQEVQNRNRQREEEVWLIQQTKLENAQIRKEEQDILEFMKHIRRTADRDEKLYERMAETSRKADERQMSKGIQRMQCYV